MNKRHVCVGEAAKVLGVAPNTVRAWGERGALKEYRHPCNNYRLFLLSELKQLKKKIDSPK